jgi:hypothetical protein
MEKLPANFPLFLGINSIGFQKRQHNGGEETPYRPDALLSCR